MQLFTFRKQKGIAYSKSYLCIKPPERNVNIVACNLNFFHHWFGFSSESRACWAEATTRATEKMGMEFSLARMDGLKICRFLQKYSDPLNFFTLLKIQPHTFSTTGLHWTVNWQETRWRERGKTCSKCPGAWIKRRTTASRTVASAYGAQSLPTGPPSAPTFSVFYWDFMQWTNTKWFGIVKWK